MSWLQDILSNPSIRWLQEILSDPFHIAAIVITVSYFFISLLGIRATAGRFAANNNIAPSVLTSIGIFFTFLGILIALLNFDVANIDAAIPELLSGLKLAFFSSVLGLGLSVVFKWLQTLVARSGEATEVGAEELYAQLRELNNNTLSVRDALVGDGETSLSTQFGKLRNDFRDLAEQMKTEELYAQLSDLNSNTLSVRDALVGDGDASLSTQFGKLRNDFRDFAQQMKEDGTQALVQALEEVIKDFNEKITEQFGDNFKQLNQAVAALLEWQKDHKTQVESLTEAFTKTQAGIAKIEQSTALIPSHMERIKTVFEATEKHVTDLYEGLASLADMRDKAAEAVPQLQELMENVTTDLKRSLEEQVKGVDNQLAALKSSQESANANIEAMTSDMSTFVKSLLDKTEDVLQSLNKGADNVLESADKVTKQVKETVDDFIENQKSVTAGLIENQERVSADLMENQKSVSAAIQKEMQDSFKELDQRMQEQLQRSLDKMGDNLTTITEKFDDVVQSLNTGTESVLELTDKVIAKAKETLDDFIENQKNVSEKMQKEMREQLQKSLENNLETINNTLQKLDQGMQDELQRSLDKMGNNLTSITKTFIDTYKESAGEIVELIKKLGDLNRQFGED